MPANADQAGFKQEQRFWRLFEKAPVAMSVVSGLEFIITWANDRQCSLWQKTANEILNKPLFEIFPELKSHDFVQRLNGVYHTGITHEAVNVPAHFFRNGILQQAWFDFTYQPLYDEEGIVNGILVVSAEVTAKVQRENETHAEHPAQNYEEGEHDFKNSFNHIATSILQVDLSALKWETERLKLEGVSDFAMYMQQHPESIDTFMDCISWKNANSQALLLFGASGVHDLLANMRSLFVPESFSFLPRKVQAIADNIPFYQDETILLDLNRTRHIHVLFSIDFPAVKNYDSVLVTVTDITAQRNAEAELAQHKQFTDAVIKASPSLTYIFDMVERRNVFLSSQGPELLGYTDAEIQAMGSSMLDTLLHPADKEATLQRFLKLQGDIAGTVFETEYRMKHRSGHWVWIYDRARVFQRDDQGVATQIVGVATDITSRIKAEEVLRQSESNFRSLTQTLPQTIWTADPSGKVDFVNDYWYGYTGATPLTTLGHLWAQYVHPDDKDPLLHHWSYALQSGKEITTEFRVRAKDGSYKWFTGDVKPVRDTAGNIIKWMGILTDVDQRKKAELLLRDSEERFRKMSEHSPVWIWMTDKDANITYANQEMLSYIGLLHNDTVPDRLWDTFIHSEDIQSFYNVFAEASEKQAVFSFESRARNSATNQFEWCFFKGVPHFEKGSFSGFIGTGLHIQQHKELTETLNLLVKERTAELEVMNARLLSSNEELQQFVHVASHDLKEPVRKVLTFISLINREFGSSLPERASQYISRIEAAAKRSFDMIDGVLQYASINTSNHSQEIVDLNQVMDTILADLEVLIAQKQAVIQAEILPKVHGHPILLYQLLYNLVINSLKFTKTGETPVVFVRSTSVDMPDEKAGQGTLKRYVRLSVGDKGIGFSQEHAERIFQPFTRLNAKDHYEGSGMGLSFCKKISERYGGFIEAESEEGEGAVFHVFLPDIQSHDPLS